MPDPSTPGGGPGTSSTGSSVPEGGQQGGGGTGPSSNPPSPTNAPSPSSTTISPSSADSTTTAASTGAEVGVTDAAQAHGAVGASLQGPSQPNASSVQHPSPAGPSLPPRNYSRDPNLLVYRPAPPPMLPNQALPKFLNLLAYFILITGSSATLVAFLYRSYVYPKLVLLKARLTALRRHDLSLYDRLLLSLHSLVESHPKIYANTKQLIEYRSQSLIVDPTAEISLPGSSGNEDSDVEKALRERNEQPANDVPPHDREDAASEDTLVEGKATPEPVNVTADLQESLSRLAEKLSAYAHRDKAESANEKLIDDDEDDAALPEPSASQLLSKSLEQFTAKLTNETFYSSAPSYPSSMYGYNYAAGSSTTMSGMDKELMVKVKNDIRMLKGMFLTRRNFATPGKVDVEAS